jgi:undecaprenyl-diphosphatase
MGVHYPGDILGGMILGSLIGWFVYWLYKKVSARFSPAREPIYPLSKNQDFSVASVQTIILSGTLTIVVVYISSVLLLDLM